MPAFNKFDVFTENLAEAVHNLQSHTLKVMLTNTAPIAANAVKADITELGAGNGYTAGGNTVTVAASAQTGGVYKLTLNDTVFTAAGGSIGPFRYAVLYNDTPASPLKPLIGWSDYGAAVTLADGETFTVDFDATNGVLTLT
jgi:hypothetical protein